MAPNDSKNNKLVLYYSPGACSLAVHIALRENNHTFTLDKVNLKTHMTAEGLELIKINPKNYVPTLLLPDGQVRTEVVSILYELEPSNIQTLEILCFISTELHKSFGVFFNPKTPEEYKAIMRDKLIARFDYVETLLVANPYLLGDNFSVADAYLFVMLRWLKFVDTGLSIENWPYINNYYMNLTRRQAIQAAVEEEHLVI